MKPTVIISNLGTHLDGKTGEGRWERWRPTVSLFQQEDFEPSRLVLLHDPKFAKLAETVERDVGSVSPTTEVELFSQHIRDPWDFADVYAHLYEFAQAYPFDPEKEDYLFHMTTGTHVTQICMFLLVESGHMPGRLVQTSPPKAKKRGHINPGIYTIIDLDLSRYDKLAARFEEERRAGVDYLKQGIATNNPGFNELMERMEQVALHSSDPMLLTGPTGVGKTALARRLFELKQRTRQVAGEYVEINCATLRGDGAMSTLFGHTKGAFTGAAQARDGLLKRANGGLLFLDEIGELGLDEQAMLLRALEEGTYFALGADESSQTKFTLIAGTNRNLLDSVRGGTFREDLLARINLWTFALPALRERPEDIEPNLEFELQQIGAERNRALAFNKEAREHFLAFATSPRGLWRSNFRDFAGALRRMTTLALGGRVTLELVNDEIERLEATWSGLEGHAQQVPSRVQQILPGQDLDLFERAQLEQVLETIAHSHSIAEAGRTLFTVSRQKRASQNDGDRLRKYLARFGLNSKGLKQRLLERT